MAVNHFAPYLLTRKLLPLLERAAAARIVNVSSMTHADANIDLADLDLSRRWDAYAAYATSKLANALHPGVIGTKLLKSAFRMQGDTVANGARTSVYLATASTLATTTGGYFIDRRAARASRLADDPHLVEGLWQTSALRLAAYL